LTIVASTLNQLAWDLSDGAMLCTNTVFTELHRQGHDFHCLRLTS